MPRQHDANGLGVVDRTDFDTVHTRVECSPGIDNLADNREVGCGRLIELLRSTVGRNWTLMSRGDHYRAVCGFVARQ